MIGWMKGRHISGQCFRRNVVQTSVILGWGNSICWSVWHRTVIRIRADNWCFYNTSLATGVMGYPETVLVFIKYMNTVTSEAEHKRMFPERKIYLIWCVQYIRDHKWNISNNESKGREWQMTPLIYVGDGWAHFSQEGRVKILKKRSPLKFLIIVMCLSVVVCKCDCR